MEGDNDAPGSIKQITTQNDFVANQPTVSSSESDDEPIVATKKISFLKAAATPSDSDKESKKKKKSHSSDSEKSEKSKKKRRRSS